MGTVDISVSQNADLAVTDLFDIKLVADAGADCADKCLNFGVFQHFVDACSLDVQDLSSNGQDSLVLWVTSLNGRTTSRVTFDDEDFGFARHAGGAVSKLAG